MLRRGGVWLSRLAASSAASPSQSRGTARFCLAVTRFWVCAVGNGNEHPPIVSTGWRAASMEFPRHLRTIGSRAAALVSSGSRSPETPALTIASRENGSE